MGTSTDGILFYGLPLGDDCLPEEVAKAWGKTLGLEPDEYNYYDSSEMDWEEVFYAKVEAPDYPDGETQYANGATEQPSFRHGVPYDQGKYGPVGDRTPEAIAKWDAEWTRVREERKKADDGAGCIIDSHCSGDYPMRFVAHKERHYVCSRGDMMEITPGMFAIPAGTREAIKDFCELMDIPWEEPKWYLVSYWG